MSAEDRAPWRLLSLLPLGTDKALRLFGDLADRTELTLLPRPSHEALYEGLSRAELVLGSWQGTHQLPLDAAAVAAAGPSLVFVQQPSVGTDSIDVEAFAAKSVPVANTRGANARSVAEWVLGATLAVTRSLVWADSRVRLGEWPQLEPARRGHGEIRGLRIGVLGYGAAGSTVAELFAALGCDVAYWSRRCHGEASIGRLELSALYARSDVLVLCLPLTRETTRLVDSAALAALPAGAVVVNVGRGGVLDEVALLEQLNTGHLGGAALDVHSQEPLPVGHPILAHERVLLSPHSAGNTRQSVDRVMVAALANLRRVVAGQPAVDVVNGVSPIVARRGSR